MSALLRDWRRERKAVSIALQLALAPAALWTALDSNNPGKSPLRPPPFSPCYRPRDFLFAFVGTHVGFCEIVAVKWRSAWASLGDVHFQKTVDMQKFSIGHDRVLGITEKGQKPTHSRSTMDLTKGCGEGEDRRMRKQTCQRIVQDFDHRLKRSRLTGSEKSTHRGEGAELSSDWVAGPTVRSQYMQSPLRSSWQICVQRLFMAISLTQVRRTQAGTHALGIRLRPLRSSDTTDTRRVTRRHQFQTTTGVELTSSVCQSLMMG